MRRFVYKLWIIAVFCLVLAFCQGRAWAVEDTSRLGIVPAKADYKNKSGAWFVYEKTAGEMVNDRVAVVNLSDQPIEVAVFGVDATTTKDGVYTLKNNNQESTGVGLWVSGLPEKLSLEAKERKVIDFSLEVPEGIKPGDYLGGLVVENLENQARNGVRIYLTVPGEMNRSAEIADLKFVKDKGSYKFLLKLKNNGNVRLEGLLVKVNLRSKWKMPAESKASYPQAGVLFPEGEISLELPWENSRPILGQFEAEVNVLFGSEISLTRRVEFWMVNWLGLGISLLSLAGFLGGLVVWFKKAKKQRIKRKQERAEREKAAKLVMPTGGGVDAEWLKEQLRVVVREELERLVVDGKIDLPASKGKRFVNPPGIKLPRGVHSREVANGKVKKFFFAKKTTK